MFTRRFVKPLALLLALSLMPGAIPAQTSKTAKSTVQAEDLKKWLTYLSSDELEGRATFSEGLGIAAAYIAEQLRSMGVKPGGDNGSYFQRVRVLGVKTTNRSTLTVAVNGQTRTFKDGEGIVIERAVKAGDDGKAEADMDQRVGHHLDDGVPQAVGGGQR